MLALHRFAPNVALATAVVVMACVPAATASPRAEPSAGRAPDAFAYATVKSVVRFYDARGRLVSRKVHRLGRVGPAVKARDLLQTGSDTVGPTSQGTGRDDITYVGHSTLGAKLYSWTVWTKWSWDHLSCPCTVSMIDKGTIHQEFDKNWSFNGVDATDNHYNSGAGGPHTSYTHDATGEFVGVGVGKRGELGGILTVYRRPRISLVSANNGTDQWFQWIS